MSGVLAGVLMLVAWLGGAPAAFGDDIRGRQRWVLDALNVDKAWRTTKGRGVTVAVLDTGVDGHAPDLAGAVTTGPDLIEEVDRRPKRLHGTGMASLIAGHGHGPDGTKGVVGVAPEARLLSVRVIADHEEPGYGDFRDDDRYDAAPAEGIRYAVDHGADVINLSLGGPGADRDLRAAIADAISRGVVVVASAGNDGHSTKVGEDGYAPYSFPASFPGVISVAALRRDHRAARFSDRNASVLVGAPGVGIPIAGPHRSYWIVDGTSPAAALVSGVVALIRSKHPHLKPGLVSQALTATTRHRPSGGYDTSVGFGEVDAAAALAEADRLAKYGSGPHGKAASRRFGDGEVEPVQVVHHSKALLFLGGWVGVAALLGLFGAGAVAVGFVRRNRTARDAEPQGAEPPNGRPPPYSDDPGRWPPP